MSSRTEPPIEGEHVVSVVIPVYKGQDTLSPLVNTIAGLAGTNTSPDGNPWRVAEVVLVSDRGPDRSDETIRGLSIEFDFVRPVWLSRNFGQHSATLAGMASSGSEWIATLDEDGQHDPGDIGVLLDAALRDQAELVYGRPTNRPPHGVFRNASSRFSKIAVAAMSGNRNTENFQSYRLVLGEIGRSVAAYAGAGVYLDVALSWVTSRTTTAGITLREEDQRQSGYSTRKLISHFWRLILSSGTRALRLVSAIGAVLAVSGIVLAAYFVIQRIAGGNLPQGWTSLITVVLISSGAIMFSLGVVAEYLGVAVNMAMGKPPYLVVSDPARGPLGRGR